MKVTTSAPGKLMLTGSHAVVHGRPCLVTAVDQRIKVMAESVADQKFYLEAADLGLTGYSKSLDDLGVGQPPKAVRFVESFLNIFWQKYPQSGGIKVVTQSDFSSQVGFGSSSAVTVALAKAVSQLYQVELTNYQLFDLCYQAVISVQAVGSGFDIASAIWGGTIYYISPAKEVRQLDIDYLPLVVAYTGVKADTPTLVKMVDDQFDQDPDRINLIFDQIGQITEEAYLALEKKDWSEFGQLLNRHQLVAAQLGVSSPELDRLTRAANQAGASGAAFSGAGGGDCMITVVDDQTQAQVSQALENAGGQVINLVVNANGVQYEKNNF